MEIAVQETPTRKKPGPKPKEFQAGAVNESPNVIVKESGIEGVEFFGKVDINKYGNIASEMPSWYFRTHKEEISENIKQSKAAIDRGEIAEEKKPQMLADIRKMEAKLDAINESEPKLKGPQEERIDKINKSLGAKIAESMYSRSDMMRGIADAHEEARRMSEPCIKLDDDEYILAKKMGCKISKEGEVSRNDAQRLWKLGRRALGENSNTEILRRG